MDPEVRLLSGAPLASQVLEACTRRAAALRARGIIPTLALVSIGDDPASKVYLARKEEQGTKAGIMVRAFRIAATAPHRPKRSPACLRCATIRTCTGSCSRCRCPTAGPRSSCSSRSRPPRTSTASIPSRSGGSRSACPASSPARRTASSRCSQHYKVPLAGRRVTIVGRSGIVGTPLALLLSRKGVDATVTLAHSRTADLEAVCREADVLVAALGVPRALGAAHVKKGAIVVDVGIHRVVVDGAPRLVGDVDAEAVHGIAAALSPVPGGVGPLTVAFLLSNTLDAAERAS